MANISDVAELAGVSVATVSRYFSSPEKVAKKSIDKVAAAVEKLNYTPNLLARNFSQSRSYTVMVLVPDLNNHFLANLIQGMLEAGNKLGYHFILRDIDFESAQSISYYDMPESRLVDGIIQLFADLPVDYESVREHAPIVLICDCEEDSQCPSVAVEDTIAAEDMVQHLIELGHKRIACLKGADFIKATNKRLTGYQKTLAKAGLKQDLIIEGDYSLESGFRAAKQIAKLESPPTAVFCMSDTMAMGLIKGLKKEGFKIPEEISITGFDDISIAEYIDPALTTIRQPTHQLGTTAMQLMVDLIENPEQRSGPVVSHRLPTELVVRESTCPPK